MAKCKNLDEAIQKVLSDAPEPMRAPEIWGEIVRRKLWKRGKSATPIVVVSAYLSDRSRGDNPLYEKVDRGLYRLHPANKAAASGDAQPQKPEAPEKSRLIQNFGMFWDRDKVKWDSKPQLWGHQDGGSRIDFGDQRGIYILYHFNKVVYVGRTTDRGIGIRLKEHTKDEHKNRWNQFSWFGIRELKKGSDREFVPFGEQKLAEDAVIADLEALLIEFADPPRNRKRGEAMEAIEYSQA